MFPQGERYGILGGICGGPGGRSRLAFYPVLYDKRIGKHDWPKDGICRFPSDAVTEVVLGPLTSPETEAKIRHALKRFPSSIVVRKARLHRIDYAIQLSDT